jgi:N-acetylmuramoyl-L-alanine amidase
MIKKIFGAGVLKREILKASIATALAFLPVLALAAPSRSLDEVSIVTGEGGVRIELEVSARTKTSYFTLENPHRIVVDLKDTRLARGARMPAGIGAVDVIRTGPRPDDGLRVVLELKSATRSRGEWMPAFADVGERFVIAVGSKGFIASTFAPSAVEARLASTGSASQTTGADSSSQASRDVGDSRSGPAASRGDVKPSAPAKAATATGAASPTTVPATLPAPKVVRPTHAPADGDRDIVVAVDAGHGGQDPGAIGRNGTMEKDVVLAIARALAARINSEPGMRAYLVRDDDYFVVLRDRMRRARNARADIFVSVHADAIRDRSISGASVYILSERGASSEAARWLAERENAADLMGGVKLDDKDQSLASVLLDLSQTANISASMTAAERVLLSLDRSVEVRKPKVQQAGLIVLKSPDIPSMLVETAYISNPREEARLKSVKHQRKVADAIFQGIHGYFETNPPPGTRFAQIQRSQLAGLPASPATP